MANNEDLQRLAANLSAARVAKDNLKKQLLIEADELDQKLRLLIDFFMTQEFYNWSDVDKAQLRNQARFMKGYSDILQERISVIP